jgi:hypothetical protein
MSEWIDSLVKHAMTNVRVIKDAWGPFVIWCVIAAGICWVSVGYVYDLRLANAASQIGTLTGRVTALAGERDDLQKRLAEKSSPPSPTLQHDPDALYQFGELAARAPGGVPDRSSGTASFRSVIGGPNFNIGAPMDYREYNLSDCHFQAASAERRMGVLTSVSDLEVACRIVGLHP